MSGPPTPTLKAVSVSTSTPMKRQPSQDASSSTEPTRYAFWRRRPSSYYNDDDGILSMLSNPQSYWNFANESVQMAAESTYATLASLVSSFYTGQPSTATPPVPAISSTNSNLQMRPSIAASAFSNQAGGSSSWRQMLRWNTPSERTWGEDSLPPDPVGTDPRSSQHSSYYPATTTATMTPRSSALRRLSAADWAWMVHHNPYNSVRGRHAQPSSLSAVRSLLALVPSSSAPAPALAPLLPSSSLYDRSNRSAPHRHGDESNDLRPSSMTITTTEHDHGMEEEGADHENDSKQLPQGLGTSKRARIAAAAANESTRHNAEVTDGSLEDSWLFESQPGQVMHSTARVSAAETASQLAEGTIRALRDIGLEEALELHASLRFWTYRWERPLLSWIEAGPPVWFSGSGYNHNKIGQLVSQIQSVLARRCASIGELQQHLLTAGWQRGVAQWGVLGQGVQWAAVAGFDGYSADVKSTPQQHPHPSLSEQPSTDLSEPYHLHRRQAFSGGIASVDSEIPKTAAHDETSQIGLVAADNLVKSGSLSHEANLLVKKGHGGGIFVDHPSFLAEWSMDGLDLVRRLLFRAGNGTVSLPYESNWRYENLLDDDSEGQLISAPQPQERSAIRRRIPQWVCQISRHSQVTSDGQVVGEVKPMDGVAENSDLPHFAISDLPLMVVEVEELLDVMEGIMEMQRCRRLHQLRPTSWLRRNWYILAAVGSSTGMSVYWIISRGQLKDLIRVAFERISSFFGDRVRDPLVAIFNEIWKGRESFSDQKARVEAIESLKKMIRSWLDDTYPHMPESVRQQMADAMDVSLIEKKKEESMKTFYEINNVVRMSFIEMQYMKKEMMNALHAMDEMMSANDINMNIAAITPVAILAYLQIRLSRFLYYALLKLGKSREETYASIRNILTDIERLLVMRDNPPRADPSRMRKAGIPNELTGAQHSCVLGSDDLGMLMLLVHECRSILWRDRRRFTEEAIQSFLEDLAELVGERGAVSVQQQLQIVARMSRTYPFLKVISTGHIFQYSRLRMLDS